MHDLPAYVKAITIAGTTAIPAATCAVLYGGAERAGLGRRRAALLTGGAAVVLGGSFTATAFIAGHGWHLGRKSAALLAGRYEPASSLGVSVW